MRHAHGSFGLRRYMTGCLIRPNDTSTAFRRMRLKVCSEVVLKGVASCAYSREEVTHWPKLQGEANSGNEHLASIRHCALLRVKPQIHRTPAVLTLLSQRRSGLLELNLDCAKHHHDAGLRSQPAAAPTGRPGPELRPGPVHRVHAMERSLSLHRFLISDCRGTIGQHGACIPKRRSAVLVEPRTRDAGGRGGCIQR